MADSGPATATARHWLTVAGAASLTVFASFMFLSASFVNPPMAADFGVGLSQVMIYNSLMALSGAVSNIVIGPVLLRRYGTRTTLLLASSLMTLALAGIALAPSLLVVYLLAAMNGLAFALSGMLIATLLVNAWFEARRGTVLGIVMSISGLGGVALGVVMPAVVGTWGWRGAFALLTAMSAVLVVLPGVALIRSTPADVGLLPAGATPAPAASDVEVQVPGVPRALAFRTPQFALLAVAMVAYHAVQAVLQHLVPLYAEHGQRGAAGGSLVAVFSLATVGATLVVGMLADRFGTLPALWFSGVMQASAVVILWIGGGYVPLAVGTAVLALGSCVAGVLMSLVVMAVFGPKDFGLILGPTMATIPIGMAVASPAWGLVKDVTGSYSPALVASVPITLMALVCFTWVIRSAPSLRRRVEKDFAQTYALDT